MERDALALGQTIGPARSTELLAELDAALDSFGRLACVQEFKELLRLVVTESDAV